MDNITKVFQFSLLPTLGLFLYLFWGLFSGQLADVQGKPTEAQHALLLVNQLSFYLNISLVVTLLTSILLFYEVEAYGFILTGLGAFLAYGLQFCIDMLFASDAARMTSGAASKATLHEIFIAAMMIGAPGILIVLRSLFMRFFQARQGEDLANMQYGSNASREDVKAPLIGAFAKCWQLPFCREGIRKGCPIFHARTKCWKERVGCMCEENILIIAMGGNEAKKGQDMTKDSGFVPIGDLLTKNAEEKKANISTRPGPRGVRIPTNPHLTDTQKRHRCQNCVIYNEHQRQKYQLLSPPVTLAVPVLVFANFDGLVHLVRSLLQGLDSLVGHLSFTGGGQKGLDLAGSVSGNLPIETLLIVCLTLVLMTWAQRLLEFCTFKIKI